MKHTPISRRKFIGSTLVAGAVASGQSWRLSADDVSKPLYSVGLIADAQYVDADPRGSRYYRNSLGKLHTAVDELLKSKPDFFVHLGDLIDRDIESFDAIRKPFDSLKTPVHQLLGNHDWEVAPKDLAEVPKRLKMKGRYSSKSWKGFRWIFLDGTDVSFYAHPKDSPRQELAQTMLAKVKERKALNAMTWNGGIGSDQMAWLNQETESARQAGEKVILCCHFPIYPDDPHNLWNDIEMLQWIDENQDVVCAWFNGHNHAGAYAERNGIHYLTLHGMVETEQTSAFARLDLHRNAIRVHGYGRAPSRELNFRKI